MSMNNTRSIKGFLGVSKSLWRDPRTWLVLLAITEKNLFRYFMLVLNIITGSEGLGVVLLHVSYIILIALCLKKGSRFYGGDILIMALVVFAILLTWIIYPNNIEKYMFGEQQFWATVFPLFRYFIVGLFLIPNEETFCLLGKVSCVSILVESLFVYFILAGSDLQKNDDMSRAYFILLNVLLVVNYAFDKKRILGITFSVIGILFLASMGTRGPVVITFAFIAARIIQSFTTSKGKGLIAVAVMLFLILFVNSDNWGAFLLFIRGLLDSLGMSTRVIDIALEGETLTYYSERDEIAQTVIRLIKERPFSGWGVYGEWKFVGWSAHNMYLELFCHYGIIVGGFITLWMFFINIKAYLVGKWTQVRSFVLLLACFALVRGFFGGGFLTFPTFLMIGYCLQVCRKTNIKYLCY